MKILCKAGQFFVLLSVAFAMIFCMAMKKPVNKTKPVVIGYVGGYRGLVDTSLLDVTKLTHINYAFINIKNGMAFLNNQFTDSVNLVSLSRLKQKNPLLQILISVGGWSWSENFSDAALSDSSRKVFAKSAVEIVRKYQLDGVDIDWEFPGMQGEEGNIFRAKDRSNFTLLFQAIRIELDSLAKQTGARKLLTTAVGAFASFLKHTEMGKVQKYTDYINLMTYDYFPDKTGRHHANLYAAKKDSHEDAGVNAVKLFLAAGVPSNKLVLGIPFYGRIFQMKEDATIGIGDQVAEHIHAKGFAFIKDSMLNQAGYKAYRDSIAIAPYLFNSETRMFITYDDEWSVRVKCQYVLEHILAGAMFWEYDDDKKGYLLNVMNDVFYKNK